jgi:hypothetical protein
VSGDGEQVHAEASHVDRNLADGLGGVGVDQHTAGVGVLDQLGDG